MRSIIVPLFSVLAAGAAVPTIAQTAAGSSAPANSITGAPNTLSPVIVTATKRPSTVQTTSMSIMAITAAQIASRGVPDLMTLARSIPGLSIRTTGVTDTEFEMRGLNSQGGTSSVVGMYLGSVPLAPSIFGQSGKAVIDPSLYDLQRVEVLRGPQGTLYGSSSMGGTIRLIPHPAELNTYAASVKTVVSDTTSGGNINHQENGMINLPLGDKAAVRIVGSFTHDSGWIKRLVFADGAVPVDPGVFPNVSRPANFYTAPLLEKLNGVNTTDVNSIRAQFLWKPTERLAIEPMVMYELIQEGAPPAVDVNGVPTHPKTPLIKAHYQPFDAPEPQQDSISFSSLKMTYDLPYFSVTSASGFWHRNSVTRQDAEEQIASAIGIPVYDAAAGGMGPLVSSRGPGLAEQNASRQLSEEFRITSTKPNRYHLQWVAGYFYQDMHSKDIQEDSAPQGAAIFGGPNMFFMYMPEVLIQNAVYGHISWRFLPRWKVAVGLRHYHYSMSNYFTEYGAFAATAVFGNSVPFRSAASIAQSGTTPSFTLTYNFDRDHMVYLKAAKGFRLGGVSEPIPVVAASNTNPIYASQVANECALQSKLLLTTACDPNLVLQAPRTFGSDSVWSYEIGEKSTFFNHRMIANVDAYLENWNNPQVQTFLAGFPVTVNSANARIKGVEFEVQALLPRGFDFTLNGAYTDARFREDSALTGFPGGTLVPDIARVQGSAVLHWEHDLQNDRSLFGTLEEDYTGTRTSVPYGETITLQNAGQLLVHLPAYSIVNVRFGMKGDGGTNGEWTASVFVNNLTNNQVLVDPQPQIGLQTQAFSRFAITRPLTAGIDVSYRFR